MPLPENLLYKDFLRCDGCDCRMLPDADRALRNHFDALYDEDHPWLMYCTACLRNLLTANYEMKQTLQRIQNNLRIAEIYLKK